MTLEVKQVKGDIDVLKWGVGHIQDRNPTERGLRETRHEESPPTAPALPSQPTPRGCALSSDRAELPSAGLASGEGDLDSQWPQREEGGFGPPHSGVHTDPATKPSYAGDGQRGLRATPLLTTE